MTTKQEGSSIIKVDQGPKNHSQADSVLAREHPETQPFDEQSVNNLGGPRLIEFF